MDALRGAVRSEGFARLAAKLDAMPRSDDPVADLAADLAADGGRLLRHGSG